MKTKHLPDQLVDCAVQLALYSLPGMADTDRDAREAYKALATEIFFVKPRNSFRRLTHYKTKRPRMKSTVEVI
ncbi:MAG: hypothetical protein WKF66_13145 [Pedobacter sp.]